MSIRRGLERGDRIETTRISSNGRYVAYAIARGPINGPTVERSIWRADVRTGVVKALDRRRTYAGGFSFGGIDISGDGRFVAFAVPVHRGSNPRRRVVCTCVFRVDARSGRRVLVGRKAAVAASGTDPTISRDGRRIAFASRSIVMRDVHRRRTLLVPRTPAASVYGASLASDGLSVAFVTEATDVRRAAGAEAFPDGVSRPQAYVSALPRPGR